MIQVFIFGLVQHVLRQHVNQLLNHLRPKLVWTPNLFKLTPIEKRHDELTQRIFASRLIGVRDHCVVRLVVVAQLQVVREQDVAKRSLKIKNKRIYSRSVL